MKAQTVAQKRRLRYTAQFAKSIISLHRRVVPQKCTAALVWSSGCRCYRGTCLSKYGCGKGAFCDNTPLRKKNCQKKLCLEGVIIVTLPFWLWNCLQCNCFHTLAFPIPFWSVSTSWSDLYVSLEAFPPLLISTSRTNGNWLWIHKQTLCSLLWETQTKWHLP